MLVALEAADLGYGQTPVLRSVDLAVERGDYLGVVGPNGSGKTTILRALLGALLPLRGRVVRAPDLDVIGYVPQRHAPADHVPVSALDVALMGRYGRLGPGRRPGPADRAAAEEALTRLGVAHLGDRPYRDLSGGQRQRVLIARALATGSPLLVLDEPTTGMDLPSEAEILDLLDRLHDESGATVALVTHDLGVVAGRARRVALVHEGRVRVGPTAEVLTPESLTALYGVPVAVERLGGKVLIRAAKGA